MSHTNVRVELEDSSEVLNDNLLFGNDSAENAPAKGNRIIKKAKRPSKYTGRKNSESACGNDENTVAKGVNSANRVPFSKNSRKSRNSTQGRGLPKKGGAGGKGVWGKAGSELQDDLTDDAGDPNYDSDSQDKVHFTKVDVTLTPEELMEHVEPVLKEYMENGDLDEAVDSIHEMDLTEGREKVISMAITLALERHDSHREMMSQMISSLYGNTYTQQDISNAFDDLLANLNDLTLDTPDAPQVLGQFIARAVADDCLPPKYVSGYKGSVKESSVRHALDKADILLSMNHGIVRLDNVWGMGGPNRPVKALMKRISLLLKEYKSSSDIEEATRCLMELDVPHFHHQFVYEAILLVIEDTTEHTADQITALLSSMCASNVITPNQLDQGVRRIYNSMPDICIDVPSAYTLLENFAEKMRVQKLMSVALFSDLPVRGRKRFVSEGDGGLVKDTSAVY